MKITSLEIKQHEFEKTFRGYDIEEVDIFLNNIANEWERISNENKMLRMQLEIAEKEATKLREVEMSLIKTLKSAEETSQKITHQAESEAVQKVGNAKEEAQKIIQEAKEEAAHLIQNSKNEAEQLIIKATNEADEMVSKAEITVSESHQSKIVEAEELEANINVLAEKKNKLLEQLKGIHLETAEYLGEIKTKETVKRKPSQAVVVEESSEVEVPKEKETEEITQAPTEAVVEQEETVHSIASSANNIQLEEEATEELQEAEVEVVKDDLEIIEGIGPKIAEVLNNAGINSYRELATTPVYKIKDALTSAGPHYAMHDPTTWVEQGLLAAEGRMEELEKLKDELIAGRKVADTPTEVSGISESVTPETATAEMLERVNKVKAALRKAMQEQESIPTKNDAAPKKETLNDILAKQREEDTAAGGGSFFDNI